MRSRASLDLVTIRPAPLETKLHAAFSAGFRAVGLIWDEMLTAGESATEEVRLSGLLVSGIGALSGWMDEDRAARGIALARAEQAFELAANLGCSVVIAWPGVEPLEPVAAAGRFRELCHLARPYAVNVGLECVGYARQIGTVSAAWEIVEMAETPNGGLVIDTFHFHRGGSDLEMLAPLPSEKILLVQLSDCLDLPRYELANRHRLYPGSGVLPLEPLLAVLREKGYSGYYSLELLNDEYWQEDPLIVAREGLRSLRRLDIA